MEEGKLPTGIDDFRSIREGGYYYVDKTGFAERMVRSGKNYFLSRPRRFGKTLFADTLQELFEGSEELFKGLAIHNSWDWTTRYPVVHLDLGGDFFTEPEYLAGYLNSELDDIELATGITTKSSDAPLRLAQLVRGLRRKSGRPVVLLIDEYDRPILDALHLPEVALSNRNYLHRIFSAIKRLSSSIHFVFITGITRFSKVSMFSGLNNLEDISIEPSFSSICGYTDSDIDNVFAPELDGLDREEIREWYNGYSWFGDDRVYNPFDIHLLLKFRDYKPWRRETGTPDFLVNELKKRSLYSVDFGNPISYGDLNFSFEIGKVDPQALLFQSGYLTIVGEEIREDGKYHRLDFPNREVSICFNQLLVNNMLPQSHVSHMARASSISKFLRSADFNGLREHFYSIFAGIPHQWFVRANVTRYEAYVAGLFFSYCKGAGLDVRVEETTNKGREDMAILEQNNIFLFEFKAVEDQPTGDALQQLRDKQYADKFRHLGRPIHLIGVEFSNSERNIVAFDVEQA